MPTYDRHKDALNGRGDTDLYPELVWPMRLADALHFRRVQGIDLWSALTLILRQHAPGAQRLGKDFFELGVAVDASPDVADDAAQIGLEPAQVSGGAVKLIGMGVALMLAGSHRPSDRSGRYSFTRSEGDRFEVRAEVRTPLAPLVEEHSVLAVGVWHCDEAAPHNPQTGPRPEAAAHSQEVAARSPEMAARTPEAARRLEGI